MQKNMVGFLFLQCVDRFAHENNVNKQPMFNIWTYIFHYAQIENAFLDTSYKKRWVILFFMCIDNDYNMFYNLCMVYCTWNCVIQFYHNVFFRERIHSYEI